MYSIANLVGMHISTLEEYGLRCLLQVALREADKPVSVQEIARAEGLGPEYVARIMGSLRSEELVQSTRGAGGGYRLSRPAHEISVWDAITALGGPLFSEGFCDCYTGRRRECIHSSDCSVRAIWQKVGGVLRGTLEAISLEDLERDELTMRAWLGQGIGARPN
jgi:Rrf2 family protein